MGLVVSDALRAKTESLSSAKPEIYEELEQRGVDYAIRIPANKSSEWERGPKQRPGGAVRRGLRPEGAGTS